MATGTASLMTETPSRSSFDVNGNNSLTYRYSVVMDEQFASEADVRLASGLPAIGTYKNNSYVSSHGLEIDKNNPFLWFVDVTYTNNSDGYSPVSFDGSDSRLLALSYGSRPYAKTINFCYKTDIYPMAQTPNKPNWSEIARNQDIYAIKNSAGDPVVGIQEVIYSKIIRFTQVEDRLFDPNKIFPLLGTINAADLKIAGTDIDGSEGTIISFAPELKNVSASTIGYPDGKYWVSSYEVEIMTGGWYQKVINEGYRQIVEGKKVDIFNKNINADAENPDDKVQEPEKLDVDGALETDPEGIMKIIIWSKWGASWNVANFVKEIDD